MRRRSRVDENQQNVATDLRAIGATVSYLHAAGGGIPDLLVGWRGVTYLIECKGPASLKKFPQTGGLNAEQEAWHRQWKGRPPLVLPFDVDPVTAFLEHVG